MYSEPEDQTSQRVADANVARLLAAAYEPEQPDAEFAARVRETMRAAARTARAERDLQPQRAEAAPSLWQLLLGISIAAAVIVALVGLSQRDSVPIAGLRRPAPITTVSYEAGRPGHRVEDRLKPRARPAQTAPAAVAWGDAMETKQGEKRRAALPDGSILLVDQNTKLRLTGPRQVALTRGRVFVEVAPQVAAASDSVDEKAGRQKFIVRTPQRSVTALGTKFAVSVADADAQVLVTQGQVAVSGLDKPLLAGELLDGVRRLAPRATHLLEWTRELVAAAESPLVPASKHAGGALVAVDPNGQEMKLSLRKYHVDVHVEDGFARSTIDATYFNHEMSRLEGTFYFPLPPDASISRLAMYVAGTLMEGGMAERDHARTVFESIRHRNLDPALLEWVDGSTFKMRVFPLEPREEKRIVLSYTQRLDTLYGVTKYRFPAGHNLGSVHDWSAKVYVRGGADLQWTCDSHKLAARKVDGNLELSAAAKDVTPDRDLAIELSAAAEREFHGEVARFSEAEHEGQRYYMLRLEPRLATAARRARRDWIILFESSGDRDPLVARAQIEAVRGLLENAEHDDTFSILTAGTRVAPYKPEPQPATANNVAAAIKFLENTHLVGALDLEQALRAVDPLAAAAPNALLVHVGSGVPIVGERRNDLLVRILSPKTKYVGIGVGKRWNRALMKEAASRTGGIFTQINPDENIAWRAFELISTISTPRLLDVKVTDDLERPWLAFADSIAEGEQLCAVHRQPAMAEAPRRVIITGTLDGQPWRTSAAVIEPAAGAGYLPRMWAKLEIDRLLAAGAAQHKDTITALSKAMYVMSPFTSLLVLETEEMYAQYNVDRGRKDHWAMYPCPAKIPVVREPLVVPPPDEKKPAKPRMEDVAASIVLRLPSAPVRQAEAPETQPGATTAWHAMAWGKPIFPIGNGSDENVNGVLDGTVDAYYKLSLSPYYTTRAPRGFYDFDGRAVSRDWGITLGDGLAVPNFASSGRRVTTHWNDGGFQYVDQLQRSDWVEWRGRGGGGRAARPALRQKLQLQEYAKLLAERDRYLYEYDLPDADNFALAYRQDRDGAVPFYLETLDVWNADSGLIQRPWGTNNFDMMFSTINVRSGRTSLRREALGVVADEEPARYRWLYRQLGSRQTGLYSRTVEPQLTDGNGLGARIYFSTPGGRFGAVHDSLSLAGTPFEDATPFTFPSLHDWATLSDLRERNVRLVEEEVLAKRVKVRAGRKQLGDSQLGLDGDRAGGGGKGGGQADNRSQEFGYFANVRFAAPWLPFGSAQPTPPNLLYRRPKLSERSDFFRDLVAFAPGMNTQAADVLAVLEAETQFNPAKGTIDAGARKLIDRARSRGWRSVAFPTDGADEFTMQFDGAGRYAYERRTAEGLLEKVVCDGTTLWSLYPEIGLGAKRKVTRFHRAELAGLLPWVVLTADDLALGGDVRLVDERTVEISPKIESAKTDESKSASEARRLVMQLVFDAEGQLVAKRWVERPSGKVWLELALAPDGGVKILGEDGKTLAELKRRLSDSTPVDLRPDVSTLVVLPLPYRRTQHLWPTLASNAKPYYQWSEDDALAIIAAQFAEGNLGGMFQLIGQRFLAGPEDLPQKTTPSDRRIGFYTLLVSGGLVCNPGTRLGFASDALLKQQILVDPAGDHPTSAAGTYLAKLLASQALGANAGQPERPASTEGFFGRLAYIRWLGGEAKKGALKPKLSSEAVELAAKTSSPLLAWSLLSVVAESGQAEPSTWTAMAKQFDALAEAPSLAFAARYEAARARRRAGQSKEATDAIAALYREAAKYGALVPIDTELRQAIVDSEPHAAAWKKLMLETAEAHVAQNRRPLAVLMAWQCRQLADDETSRRILDVALGGSTSDDGLGARLTALAMHWHAQEFDRADAMLASVLADDRAADSAWLWKLGATVADKRGHTATAALRLEKAVDLLYRDLPEQYNVEAVRGEFSELMSRYQKVAEATVAIAERPAVELISRVIRAADRWRSLDTDPTAASQAAAKVLFVAGASDLAWDYITTPLAEKPNEASPWQSTAQWLGEQGLVDAADRAYREAFTAESTNAQILWNHAALMEKHGRTVPARELYQKIVAGQWQPRFQNLVPQAQQALARLK